MARPRRWRTGDEDLDRPKRGAHVVECLVDGEPIRDVDLACDGLRTPSAKRFGDLFRGISVEIEHRYPSTLAREVFADRSSDPRRTSGHDRDTTQLTSSLSSSVVRRSDLALSSPTGNTAAQTSVAPASSSPWSCARTERSLPTIAASAGLAAPPSSRTRR